MFQAVGRGVDDFGLEVSSGNVVDVRFGSGDGEGVIENFSESNMFSEDLRFWSEVCV